MNRLHKQCLTLLSTLLLLIPVTSVQLSAGEPSSDLEVLATGMISNRILQQPGMFNSPGGNYQASWRYGQVDHDRRELLEFMLFHEGNLLYQLEKAPGSDFYLADNGNCAFLEQLHRPDARLRLTFLNRGGVHLFDHELCSHATLFSFSESGNRFLVGNDSSLKLITLPTGEVTTLPGGWEAAVSAGGELTAIARADRLQVWHNNLLLHDLSTDVPLPRAVAFSPDKKRVALVGRTELRIYSFGDGELSGSATLSGGRTFRDLLLREEGVMAGVQLRGEERSSGFLQLYSFRGELLEEHPGASQLLPRHEESAQARSVERDRDTCPWPFFPFDSMRTVWNHYEQHMGGYGVDYSYLHQGLDLITPVAEPTFAVESGIVKCVLTLGGAVYWRIAVSPVQEPGWSEGWLYAHLIENSIQFDIGDTVQLHDYLGDIIEWSDDWGHIHFAEISDSGLVWQYGDNEWGITRNPLPLLEPLPDSSPPVFEDVFPGSRFAFCRNYGNVYLDPDSLNGELDIIVKVYDLVEPSPWQQPANTLYYWIERAFDGTVVVPRTLSYVLDHPYPFYSSDNYEPWTTLFYQRDEQLLPSSWMDTTRNYYQFLTNSDGDSLAELWEKDLVLDTADFPNGEYLIFAEAQDDNGNSSVDSMLVRFQNPGNDPAPVINSVVINSGRIFLDWSDIPGATGYTVYSSSSVEEEFEVDGSGSFIGSSWNAPLPGDEIRFYRVTAEVP